MLDIRFVASSPDAIKKSLEKRGLASSSSLVDDAVRLWPSFKQESKILDEARHKRNTITREINELRKQGKDFSSQVAEAKKITAQVAEQEKVVAEQQKHIEKIIQQLPNIMHESVPVGKDDTENEEVKRWGEPSEPSFPLKEHGALLESRGLADFERATKIAGAGFYFLKGDLVLLEQALIRFSLDVLMKKDFSAISPPLMMRKKPYAAVTDLADFENVMYKIEDEDNYLIATAEHPLAAMFSDEVLTSLPLKLVGVSTCFRKEIGSHGVDTRGLFRVHQFNKLELFVFAQPDTSWQLHEELLSIAESLMQELVIPYRVVNVCTGDLGVVAAKKYDIEGWFPRQKKYRELVSCSNCTDYQANDLNIRFVNVQGEKEIVHTLNSTALSLSRLMACIVEHYQQEDGSILVPKVLQSYLGKEKI